VVQDTIGKGIFKHLKGLSVIKKFKADLHAPLLDSENLTHQITKGFVWNI
jgi:hypothetical protein